MSRIDPRLVTIMISSVILSTLVIASIVRPAEEDPLLLLSSEFPEAILKRPDSIGLESEVSYVIMATREFEVVEIRHTCFYEKDPGIDLPPNPEPTDLPIVERLKAEVEAMGGEMEVMELRVELLGKEYVGQVMDFSRFFEAFNTADSLSTLPLTFILLTHEDEVRYFEGSPCFFLEAGDTLSYLAVSRDENKTEYCEEGRRMQEALGISDAPVNGILTFNEVSMDERFSVILQVDIPEDCLRQIRDWNANVHFLSLVRCYADSRLVLTIATPFQRGLTDAE